MCLQRSPGLQGCRLRKKHEMMIKIDRLSIDRKKEIERKSPLRPILTVKRPAVTIIKQEVLNHFFLLSFSICS